MKKKYSSISDKVKILGVQRSDRNRDVIDFYITHPKWDREYAFTRRYTKGTYELVKSGIPVKQLMSVRSRDTMVMRLVNYTELMIPYFMEDMTWISTG